MKDGFDQRHGPGAFQVPWNVRLAACTADCWQTVGYDIDFGAVDPATYSSCVTLFVSGIPVEIYGRIEVSGMIPNMWIVASQVLPPPSGLCGPLPVKSTSWGQVKTRYRRYGVAREIRAGI